ncbi:MAG: bifunctional cobalt-precorrin-7 (C(5))-methyltransferase/cobalt-precorrin-6B (C(15))-methyltransferase [Deltaproteobacteria bacterium]|nr:MAG: bifunctional cobalt-precorrin-7 (C(5))-methyltransferase/cobalt-precorrin-6B (C(15))-methyltransferase [Deltaproteobacteria bacterium]
MNKVVVIGMGLSPGDLTAAHLDLIRSADILMGGRRHLDGFESLAVQKEVITGRIDDAITFIRRHMEQKRIVVLASGDPLFFGIGARISSELGADRVTIRPNITSVAAAFARINLPWSESRIVSLHGRDRKWAVLDALKEGVPVAVLTDHRHTPGWLAGWLRDRGVFDVKLAVFEQLGMPEEVFGWYGLAEAIERRFARPNVVILKPDRPRVNPWLGMEDDLFDREKGLITKAEVRAVTLSKLALRPGQTFWDLGAGSGSVGIEAAVLLGEGRIVAVEQKSSRVAQIRANARRQGVFNLDVVQARLPDGLDGLPGPDRIFIGGGGKNLTAIIAAAAGYLPAGGVMVTNTILLDNLTASIDALEAAGFETGVTQVQISNSKSMPYSRRFEPQNPVWIITGKMKAKK